MDERDRGTIVVAVDGTDGCAGAVRYATAQAAARGLALHIVHALPSNLPVTPMMPYLPDDLVPTGKTILDRAHESVAEAEPGLAVTTELLTVGRVPALVAAGDRAHLLVLGQEGRHGVYRVLLGATTAAVAAHARCPVVAVPADWDAGATAGLVVVGVKSHRDADRLLERAFDEAVGRGATLRVVHAWELPSPYADRIEERTHETDWRDSGRQHLEALLAPHRAAHPEVPVEVRVLHAQPRAALVEEARDADLVVVLRHRSRHLTGAHLGGTARAVLALARVPVEVVPPESSPEADDRPVVPA